MKASESETVSGAARIRTMNTAVVMVSASRSSHLAPGNACATETSDHSRTADPAAVTVNRYAVNPPLSLSP